jgi:signal transduction histidine kinase
MKILLAEKSTYVHADIEKIARVLYNLIDNAVKFTQTEGEISIETTLQKSKEANSVITVSVKDNGPGIPEEDKTRVFERFYKADLSRGEDKKGSGLGLSIAKEFIKAHGESLSLTCEPGSGCDFKFTLKTTVTEED